MKTHKLQTGLSMVELMIAMLIGLFLMGGLIQLFIASKQTYKMQDTISRLQENQRFAMDFLIHDMRGISGWGCFRESANVQSLLNATGVFAQPTTGISGTDGASDTITLRSTSALRTATGGDVVIEIAPNLPSSDLSITASSVKTTAYPNGIDTGDILFIGDCEAGNIFQVTGITSNVASPSPVHDSLAHAVAATSGSLPGNVSNNLTKPFTIGATLYKLNTVTYSIGTGEGGQPSLFKQVGNNNAVELIEGVENMQILYGEDTNADGTPNRYLTSGAVNMNNVVSVQISLLMRSLDDNQTTASIPFTFNGAVVTASQTDKRIRRSITSIISIRNRLQ